MSTDSSITRDPQQRRATLRCLRLLAVDELWIHNDDTTDDDINTTADELTQALLMIIESANAEDNLAALIAGVDDSRYMYPLGFNAREVILKRADHFQVNYACWTRIGDIYDQDYTPMDDIDVLTTMYEGDNSGYYTETLDRFVVELPMHDAERLLEFGRAVHRLIGYYRPRQLAAVVARLEAARKSRVA